MVENLKLVKLCIEIPNGSLKGYQVRALYRNVKLNLLKYISLFKKHHNEVYPVSFDTLMRMCKLEITPSFTYIGIRYDSLSAEDKELYKKILSVEFGVDGKEIRILRRALEDVV